MNINRKNLIDAFYRFAEEGNGIVIGPPGIGKTFLLKEFCKDLSKKDILSLFAN